MTFDEVLAHVSSMAGCILVVTRTRGDVFGLDILASDDLPPFAPALAEVLHRLPLVEVSFLPACFTSARSLGSKVAGSPGESSVQMEFVVESDADLWDVAVQLHRLRSEFRLGSMRVIRRGVPVQIDEGTATRAIHDRIVNAVYERWGEDRSLILRVGQKLIDAYSRYGCSNLPRESVWSTGEGTISWTENGYRIEISLVQEKPEAEASPPAEDWPAATASVGSAAAQRPNT